MSISIRRAGAMAAAAGLGLIVATASASPDEALAPGSYEVRHRLELPHVALNEEAVAIVCLSGVGAAGFPVLSANNPLSRCPVTNVRRDGDEISFEIVCPGGNAAKALGVFRLIPNGFEGRIAMNMGGKNMTMSEIQRGRRVGDCGPDAQTGQRP
jgi:hypothetical protein